MPKIYGIALTKDGEPVPAVEVAVMDADGEIISSQTTGEDGIFEFDVLPGTWSLRWTAPHGEAQDGVIEVDEGDAEVELEIPT